MKNNTNLNEINLEENRLITSLLGQGSRIILYWLV